MRYSWRRPWHRFKAIRLRSLCGRRGHGRRVAVPAQAMVSHDDGAGAAYSVGDVPGSGSGNGGPVVALTFDDGPSPVYTPQVLSVLTRYQARATFFEIGRQIAADPALTGLDCGRWGRRRESHLGPSLAGHGAGFGLARRGGSDERTDPADHRQSAHLPASTVRGGSDSSVLDLAAATAFDRRPVERRHPRPDDARGRGHRVQRPDRPAQRIDHPHARTGVATAAVYGGGRSPSSSRRCGPGATPSCALCGGTTFRARMSRSCSILVRLSRWPKR